MITDPTELTEIQDKEECRDLRKRLAEFLDGDLFSMEWVTQRQWAVVPQDFFIHFPRARWIADAARFLGYEECVAVSTSFTVRCYRVPMTAMAVHDFGCDLCLDGYILVPTDLRFAIYRAHQVYNLIAGPAEFVRRAVGCSFATAREEYRLYLEDIEEKGSGTNPLRLYSKCDGQGTYGLAVYEPGAVTSIEDRTEARDLFDKARPLVSGAGHFSRKHIRDNDWIVVPRTQPMDLTEAEWIAETAIELGHKALFAAPSSDTVREIVAYRIPMNRDAILEFAQMRAKKYSVVFPIDLSFAMLIADEWYYLVGGPEDFVRKAFNRPISDAREDFGDDYELKSDYPLDDYERTSDWSQAHVRRRMHAIAERYRVFDPE